jgi:hypothetical protein
MRADFKNAIVVDSCRLRSKIVKSRAVVHAPLIAPLPVLPPGDGYSIEDRRAHFETLFAAAIETFKKDVTPEAIGTLRPGGSLANYVETTGYSLAMRAHMNRYFGLLQGLGQEKRAEGLNALLSLQESDLNCVDGMIERIDFLKTAMIGNASLLEHVYATGEEKIIWGDAPDVNVHYASRQKSRMLTTPTREEASALEKHANRQIETFLEEDVKELIRDLQKLVDAAPGAGGKAAEIQAFQEAHLPTLRWFFPPPKKEKLTTKDVAQHVTQLHQHADYFKLDEDTYEYAEVENVAILRDAIKAVLPALSMQSKIMVLHKNSELWDALKTDMFPKYIARCPDLSREEFLTEVVPFFEIPKMIKKGDGIGNLISEGVIPLDNLFASRAEETPVGALLTFNDNTCPLVDLMMAPGRSVVDVELLLEQCIEEGRGDLIDILQARAGAEVDAKAELIRNVAFLMVPGFAPSAENQLRLVEACKTMQTIESDALHGRMEDQVGRVIWECLSGPSDAEWRRGLTCLAHCMESIDLQPEMLARLHCEIILNMRPGGSPACRALNSEIIKLVAKNTDKTKTVRLGDHEVDVLLKLVEVMGKLPAGMPGQGPDNQREAYKLIKRRLAVMKDQPEKVIKLVGALWEGDTLDRLDGPSNRLPARHLGKFVTAIVGGMPRAMQGQSASSIRAKVIELTPATLIGLRENTTWFRSPEKLALMRKIDAAWGAAIARVGRADQSAGATAAGESGPVDVNPIPVDQAARLISAYLKEFDPLHFPGIEPAAINEVRTAALSRISTERMHDLLPAMYRVRKVAHLEVATHLLQREAVGTRLPDDVVKDITNSIRSIDGPGGKLNRLLAKEAGVRLRHKVTPAWMHPNRDQNMGGAAPLWRHENIQRANEAQLAPIAQKRQRLLDTRDRIVAAMLAAGVPDRSAAMDPIAGAAGGTGPAAAR